MIEERLAAWVLSDLTGVGPVGFSALIEKFGSASNVFERSVDELISSEAANPRVAQKIASPRNWTDLLAKFNATIPDGASVISLTEIGYPSKLRNLSNPPPFIYYLGDIALFEQPSLAVVGSRRPTDYGRRLTSRIVTELAQAGVVIVSGLAYGIDGVAHQAALETGGKTAAVFGCSLETIYPPGHKALAQRIIQQGCLISEFPKGTRPERFNFPVRNRIVAGLSDGVLVVEAGQRSGALVTAQIALDQNRDVLAIPGSIDSELSVGPNSLIKQGAIAVTSAEDIFANFGWHRATAAKEPTYDLRKLAVDELTIFNILSVQPVHVDEIGRKSQLGPGKTAEALLNLELKGFIMRKPGNFVVRA
jgi:DNA processing protein